MKIIFITAALSIFMHGNNYEPIQITNVSFRLTEKSIMLSTGIKLHYVEHGNSSGVPVVLLHGYTDSWRSFEKVLPLLPLNMHVFAISQRGHGNSSKPENGYDSKSIASYLAAFITQKKLGPVIVAGHSWGGMIVQQFALDYPNLVKAIIIVSSGASFKDNPGIPEFVQEIKNLRDSVSFQFASDFQHSTLAVPIDSLYFNELIKESNKVPLHVWKSVADEIMHTDLVPRLSSIQVPVLIIWGDKDYICPKESQEILLKGIKNARLIVYEGTGHALHWEQPKKFADDLVAFVQHSTKS